VGPALLGDPPVLGWVAPGLPHARVEAEIQRLVEWGDIRWLRVL
jgi:hypothetical protein